MKYQDILRELKAGTYRPIYFLMGEEAYFIDEIVRFIEKRALPEDQQSFNQTILYGRDTDIQTVIGEAKRYPMMADRVVVIVKEAQHLRKLEELESYAANPQPSTVLVLAHKYKSLDKRKKLYKTLSNAHVLMESKKLYDNQIPDWIARNLAERGYNATPKAIHLLGESLGNDLGRIDNELHKLELVVPKGQTIDDEAVEQNIGISKDYNNFELINALGSRDFGRAMQIQRYFAANPKDNPLVVTVSLLFGYFSKLMLIHQAKDKSPSGLASLLKVNPYFVKDYQKGATQYDLKKLARIISYLRECDMRSKGVGNVSTSDSDLLKELIFKIIYT
ncbi:MAG TPA: DNA polymerase III subunit delta [Cryomorphaceae bacterium]|nr:DNA polymerase III subunit delta [Owenweeksia sp.]HBF19608.1 DNA polymerase III subunit delta [Cryomorphaceae bacterium]|tara:strand:+ start:4074 stop:5075 length:1002 start_codon:yes stop_codon:yes gene_type:complete